MKKNLGQDAIYDARELGVPRMLVLGLQHLFAMFGATVLVPILVTKYGLPLSIQTTLLFAGIGTLLFHVCTKFKVPAFLGSSFAFLGGFEAVASLDVGKFAGMSGEEKLPYALGGIVVAGALYLILALLFKLVGPQKGMRFFPPIVTGPIIILIGLNLSGTAIGNASTNWWLALVAIAVIISAFNGFGMAKLHMHPFIVTLGTQLISFGLCRIYIENQPSGSTQALSSLDQRYLALATGSVDIFGFKLPYLVIIFLLLGVVTWIVWNKTRFGKNMFAVGGHSEAAEVSGVSVTKTIMGVFLYAGLMYGIPSFLEGARIQSVGTATGINYELAAIAGCVIGGVSFNGGIGTVPGVVIGSIILQAINYGLYFLGVNAYLQYIIRGAIIIIAVAIDVQKYVAKK